MALQDIKISSMQSANSLIDTDLIPIVRPTVLTNKNLKLTWALLKSFIGVKVEKSFTLTYGITNDFTLGLVANIKFLTLDCRFTRGTTRQRKQIIQIFQFNNTAQIIQGEMMTIPKTDAETGGITILDPTIESGNLMMHIEVDSSDSNNVVFDYTIINNG